MKDFWKKAGSFLLRMLGLVLPVAVFVYFLMAGVLYLMAGDFLPFGKVFLDAAKEGSNAGQVATFAVSVVTISLGSVGFYLLYLRLKNQEEQVRIQTEQVKNQGRALDHQMAKEVDDRFIAAVGLLGNAEASARTGAIYSLYQLFIDKGGKKYRRQIAQILCSHIRTKTQEKKYQKKHKDRPSNEIQTAIDLLFRNVGGNEGIYFMSEIVKQEKIPPSDLRRAFLCGANFIEARCEKSSFQNVRCSKAYFQEAYCVGANFMGAHCEAANFESARCEVANFELSHCQGIYFKGAHCSGANFFKAYCQMANFENAHCEGADFRSAYCEGGRFLNAHCQATDFSCVYGQGANFRGANFEGSFSTDRGKNYSSGAERIRGQIDKEIEFEYVTFVDNLSNISVEAIKQAKPYIRGDFYHRMQEIIKKNEGAIDDYTIPDYMKERVGVLKDSPELQKIIQKLEEIERRKADALYNDDLTNNGEKSEDHHET